jgi:TRAP-type C4-dicarboxylate transport system permease large subunit
LEIWLLTPHVKFCLYVVVDLADKPLDKIVKATMLFIIIKTVLAVLIIFLPDIALFVPKLLGLL